MRLSALATVAATASTCGGADGGSPTSSQSGGCRVVAAAVNPSTASVAVGDSINLYVVYTTAAICSTHPTVTWSANNNSAVTLHPDGEVVYVEGRAASAQPVGVTATVGGLTATQAQVTVLSAPSIKLTPQNVAFTAIQNQNTLPDSQVVHLTNGGGGVLGRVGPDATQPTVYGPGASDWLFIKKSGLTSTAPYDLFLQPRFTNFQPGTYTATVRITSPDATNSPQNIAVTYTITAGSTAPAIANLSVTPVSLNNCSAGGSTGSSFAVTFKLTDPAGNAFTGTINERVVFHPSGATASGSVRVPSTQATLANGTVTTSVCVAFLGETSFDLTLSVQSDFGANSNSLTVNVPKPAGASTIGKGAATFAGSASRG